MTIFFRNALYTLNLILFGGCLATFPVIAQTPNWAQQIAPILYKNCTPCHIQGGIAPFSLVGYSQAQSMANSIASSVESKRMPPWPADPNYQRYAHERILSTQEINLIKQWASDGAPSGNLSLAPPNPTPIAGGTLTTANVKLKMPTYTVQTTSDLYRCFVLPTNFSQNQFATALEVIPGNRQIVHHVLVFQDTSSIPVTKDAQDPGPGYTAFGGTGSSTSQLIGVYVPGQEPFVFPSGFGTKLLAGTRIILQIHYPAGVNNEVDSTSVWIQTTTNSLRSVYISPVLNHQDANMVNGPLYIPANEVKIFNNKAVVNANVTVFAVAPHQHLIGTSIKAWGVKPTSDTLKFVDVPRWDFHWQRTYQFKNPLLVPKNTVLWGEGKYDNTNNNPNNPNSPPISVAKGEGTADEMMLIYFWYTVYQSGDENIVIDTSSLKNISRTNAITQVNIMAYPNPSVGSLTIQSNEPICTVVIYNQLGDIILTKQCNEPQLALTIDLTKMEAGNFYAVIQTKNGNTRGIPIQVIGK